MTDKMEDKKKEVCRKNWENFWYYHKFHVIIGVFVIAVIAVFVRDKLKQIDYDYTVAVVTAEVIPQEALDELQSVLENIASDRNNDKKVHVLIQNYAIGNKNGESSNPQITMANQQKFIVDAQTGTSMLLIYTDEVYEMYKKQGLFAVEDGTPVKMGECSAFTEMKDGDSLRNLNISLRNIDESLWSKEKDLKAYYEDSERLLERFMYGDK